MTSRRQAPNSTLRRLERRNSRHLTSSRFSGRGRRKSYGRSPNFDSDVIPEPLLAFGGRHEHVDPKTGLGLYGPYSLAGQTRPPLRSITVGIVGPSSMVSDVEQWLQACKGMLANDGSQPFLYPHFPGFSAEHPFQWELVFGDPWSESFRSADVAQALEPTNFFERVQRVIDLYISGIE